MKMSLRAAIVTGMLAVQAASAAVVTRGPYLNTPTPSSMIVRWRTDTPTNSRVAYGSAPGSLTQMADDLLSTTEHVVSVAGLAAGTQYYYSVGSVLGAFVGDDPDHFFRTAPTTGSAQALRIWSIGDAGFTGPDLDGVRDAYKAFNGGSSTADLFLLLGDNAYLFGSDSEYQAAVFNEHLEMLRTTPVYSTFGNHERLSSQDVGQTGPYFVMFSFPTAAEAGGIASGTESYYSFDYGNVHFVVLDSEDLTPTSPASPQLTWLQADLAATTADWVIALWHRPPYSKGALHDSDAENKEIQMRTYAVPLLESFGVDVVLSGHSHSYERSYLLDGHYGLSSTFSSANQVDPGDGDPSGDGAYRKEDTGLTPNAGAVYVVNGSGSEFRNATLNHPAHVIGLLETGSLVLDVDGNSLTARFLTGTGLVHDQFRIVKGTSCAPTPATGCLTAAKGKLVVRKGGDSSKDQFAWKWKDGNVTAATAGDPSQQTDIAVCTYDQSGVLLGGALLHGGPEWSSSPNAVRYRDPANPPTRHGFRKVRVKFGTTKGRIDARGKGAGLAVPSLPAVFPVTAQLVNLDSGACWESTFTSFKRNDDERVSATLF